MRALLEILGLLERAAQPKQYRNDRATHDQGNAPAVGPHRLAGQHKRQKSAKAGGRHYAERLADGLKRAVETARLRGRDLGQIHVNAARLDAKREPLNETPDDD